MIPKRPTDDWAPHAYAVDLIEYEHAVAMLAVQTLKEVLATPADVNQGCEHDLMERVLREIEESGWTP